jgi:hypothetical protein
MANKNKRTKARRVKETKEAQHKKVVEKPIYKRPWIWIALVALVVAIVVPSAYQYNEQRQEELVREAAVWEGILPALESINISESAIKSKSFQLAASQENGEYDSAQVNIATDLRSIIATAMYDSENGWSCYQIGNEDGTHLYWSSLSPSDGNATMAAILGADGSISMAPLYDYLTDELKPEVSTGAAVEEAPETTPETTGEAVTDAPAETSTEPAVQEDAPAETTGEAAEEVGAATPAVPAAATL